MKTTATVAIAALVTLANSAGTLAFDNRPMQFMSKDGEIGRYTRYAEALSCSHADMLTLLLPLALPPSQCRPPLRRAR